MDAVPRTHSPVDKRKALQLSKTFITAYGPKAPRESVQARIGGKSLTKQSMKQECDINFIIQQFSKTGVIQHQKSYEGQYGDFMTIDFHEAMNVVAEANSMFESVPAAIRKEFGNDPKRFLDFVTNPENDDKLREMRLIPPIAPPPEPGPAVAPAEPSPLSPAPGPSE